MTATPTFDLRKPVRERNLKYLIVMPLLAGCLIFLGWWLIPDTFVWELSGNAIESMTTSSFLGIGIGLCVAGIFHFAKAIVHSFSFIGANGEWHFRLTHDELLWDVPKHSFGPEVGFVSKLSNIKEIEYRTITEYEAMDVNQYWIHFRDREPVQLMDYTGYTMSALVLNIHEAGVRYKETTVHN